MTTFTKDFLIEHWKRNWELAGEDFMHEQALRLAAEEVIRKIGHTTTCSFKGCDCGRAEQLKLALGQYTQAKLKHESEQLGKI